MRDSEASGGWEPARFPRRGEAARSRSCTADRARGGRARLRPRLTRTRTFIRARRAVYERERGHRPRARGWRRLRERGRVTRTPLENARRGLAPARRSRVSTSSELDVGDRGLVVRSREVAPATSTAVLSTRAARGSVARSGARVEYGRSLDEGGSWFGRAKWRPRRVRPFSRREPWFSRRKDRWPGPGRWSARRESSFSRRDRRCAGPGLSHSLQEGPARSSGKRGRERVRVSVRVPVDVPNHVLMADWRARARTRPSVLE
jgi:hypothetical protein